jgi:hypothetical protein
MVPHIQVLDWILAVSFGMDVGEATPVHPKLERLHNAGDDTLAIRPLPLESVSRDNECVAAVDRNGPVMQR